LPEKVRHLPRQDRNMLWRWIRWMLSIAQIWHKLPEYSGKKYGRNPKKTEEILTLSIPKLV